MWQNFNPLPPHGGRLPAGGKYWTGETFQSTPSAWRETSWKSRKVCFWKNFNPLPPHGGRPAKDGGYSADFAFQSTPSAWRETNHSFLSEIKGGIFQSTPSAWRETYRGFPIRPPKLYFNPLPPHGGRQALCFYCVNRRTFQSTPSAWRETAKLHRKAFFISPILVQSCKKGCKRLHSAPEKMVFFEKREKNLVRNLQHLSVRL